MLHMLNLVFTKIGHAATMRSVVKVRTGNFSQFFFYSVFSVFASAVSVVAAVLEES